MSIKVVFMGTPDFAVESLKAISNSSIEIVGVITAPDKPAGRGKKIQCSAVKTFAIENNIGPILQPTNLKDPKFIDELKALNADLFAVVAFRMLPEIVWSMPPKGTINLHASLLPAYRGAAPINWAVINGENKSGVTTFFIRHEIDTGNIIEQKEVEVTKTDTAGSLHDKLMYTGSELLVHTILNIEADNITPIAQDQLAKGAELKHAPKIFKDDCRINWDQPSEKIYNFIRGLSPYPAAWTEFRFGTDKTVGVKIFDAGFEKCPHKLAPGTIDYSQPKAIKIASNDGFISLKTLQQAGKKRMDTQSFLLGFSNKEDYKQAF